MGSISQQAFNDAVDQHYRLIYQLAAGLLKDSSEAQDVTQETFTQYWQHGESALHIKAWLIRVARNRCLDRLRRRNRVEYREPELLPDVSDHRDTSMNLELDELRDGMREAVDALPEPQRSIVILFSLRGMSGKECAEALDISVNQVKVYLHRARARLKKQIESLQLVEQEV